MSQFYNIARPIELVVHQISFDYILHNHTMFHSLLIRTIGEDRIRDSYLSADRFGTFTQYLRLIMDGYIKLSSPKAYIVESRYIDNNYHYEFMCDRWDQLGDARIQMTMGNIWS